MGKDHETLGPDGKTTLSQLMQRGVFPFLQGAPIVNNIVAKARALDRSMTPEFADNCHRIVELSRALSAALMSRGARVISGGSDNHIVVVDVLSTYGVTGIVAEKALEDCHIIVNKNRIAGDTKSPRIGSGIRIGTNSLAAREFLAADMDHCADLIARVLSTVEAKGDRKYELDDSLKQAYRDEVHELCRRYPIPGYPI